MTEKNAKEKNITLEQVYENINNNMDFLMKKHGYTTKGEVARLFHMAESTFSKHTTGSTALKLDFLVQLKNTFACDMEEFLFGDLSKKKEVITAEDAVSDYEYRRFHGLYRIYYYDNSSFKGRERAEVPEALKSGILAVCKKKSSESVNRVVAVFNMTKEEADVLYEDMQEHELECNYDDLYRYVGFSAAETNWRVQIGTFDLSARHMYLELQFQKKEKALLIFHRPDAKERDYVGGLGAMVSVSDSVHPSPCLQYMGITKCALDASSEEIAKHLLTHYPGVKTYDSIDKLIDMVVSCYKEDENQKMAHLDDDAKKLMIRYQIDKILNDTIDKNLFRSVIVSAVDDDEWKHFIRRIGRV